MKIYILLFIIILRMNFDVGGNFKRFKTFSTFNVVTVENTNELPRPKGTRYQNNFSCEV